MAGEEHKALYRRFVENVINQGQFDLVPEVFSPEYQDHSAPPGAPGGLDGVKAVFAMFRTAFPDVHFTIIHMVSEGDMVATFVEGEGTQNGPFMGLAPSGRHAKWTSSGFFRVKDGRIVEHWGIPDFFSLMAQLNPSGGHP
jgi:predicted ester cyclase